jgi:rhamnose transport system ATP-binding protein
VAKESVESFAPNGAHASDSLNPRALLGASFCRRSAAETERIQMMLLQAKSITKTFAGVKALKGVSFDLSEGEVHALVGENGAGKSTLIKIMSGAVKADSGMLFVSGRPVTHNDPALARSLGIAVIYQQPALFPHLTVSENIALAFETGSLWRRVNWKRRHAQAAELLNRIGASIDPDRLVSTLSMPEQQLVEIAKAIGAEAKILIMDEPTASLTDREVANLFGVIDGLRSRGVGIIYISHRLEEISSIADRITVLRDGESVGTKRKEEVDRSQLINMIVGRELSAVFPKREVPKGDVVLELRSVENRDCGLHDISISVRAGEILGLAGLVGAGRTELAETVFGLMPMDRGDVLLRGDRVRISSPSDAIRSGIAYLPEDRRQHGVILDMPISANTSLAKLKEVSRRGLIDAAREKQLAESYVERLSIKTPSVDDDLQTLSGGNQQKVALARWLATRPAVLILDEPTQGVDVGSKSEIHGLMIELAERGVAIIMISSELPEILGMSDRIAVMHAGAITGILSREEATQQKILALALGRTSLTDMPHV